VSIPARGSGGSSVLTAPSDASSIPQPIEAPGIFKHLYGNHFPLGEPSGEITADVQLLSRSVSPPPV
jgi:hypothetical protein